MGGLGIPLTAEATPAATDVPSLVTTLWVAAAMEALPAAATSLGGIWPEITAVTVVEAS